MPSFAQKDAGRRWAMAVSPCHKYTPGASWNTRCSRLCAATMSSRAKAHATTTRFIISRPNLLPCINSRGGGPRHGRSTQSVRANRRPRVSQDVPHTGTFLPVVRASFELCRDVLPSVLRQNALLDLSLKKTSPRHTVGAASSEETTYGGAYTYRDR